MPFVPFPAPTQIVLSTALVCLIGACSGSGGSGVFGPLGGDSSGGETPVDPDTPDGQATFDELAALGQTLFAKTESLSVTPEANMPTTGTATYRGAVSYVSSADLSAIPDAEKPKYIVDNPQVVSDATLNANFGASTIFGTLANFTDRSTGVWQGGMSISNGVISGSDFTGDMGGSIGPAGEVYPSTGTVKGVFGGDAAEYAYGAVRIDRGLTTPDSTLIGVLGSSR
ncbi:transferrin-binding protein-like solute binding protein [Tabrizicola sp. J26]|nr:transferrin-binding protein-like solute binding protein [Tabrizicola rongguiensis]